MQVQPQNNPSPFGLSPPVTCRAARLNPPVETSYGQVQRGGYEWTTPEGVQYQMGGMIPSNFNKGLRLPQQRTFLGPEYFNGGCFQWYCKGQNNCPNSVQAKESPAATALFEMAFSSNMPFTGNNAPPSCFQGVCSGYNSTVGWEFLPSGQMRWQQQTPNQ